MKFKKHFKKTLEMCLSLPGFGLGSSLPLNGFSGSSKN